MIGLHYQDEGELAGALLSLARRCQELDARLFFSGPEAACEEARRALNLDPSALRSLTFRTLPHPSKDLWGIAPPSWARLLPLVEHDAPSSRSSARHGTCDLQGAAGTGGNSMRAMMTTLTVAIAATILCPMTARADEPWMVSFEGGVAIPVTAPQSERYGWGGE